MNRISQLRKHKKISQKEFGAMIGVAQNTVCNWEKGNREPDNESLLRMSEIFGVPVDYILGRDNCISTQATIPEYDNIFRIEKKRYPLLGDIACGQPIYADEDHESFVLAGGAVDADFCLRAKGDSMVGARILDGDIVFIKETPTVQNGEIAAAIIGDEATLKRVYYYPEKGKLVLNAENPKYEPFIYVGDELSTIRILGKAVAFQSVVR